MDALTSSIQRHGGRALRIDPLPANYKGNETSRDAEVGLMFGLSMRAMKCPNERKTIREAWRRHRDFVKDNGMRLHEGSNTNFMMNPAIQFVWDLVSYRFGFGMKPNKLQLRAFEAGMLMSVETTRIGERACYPLHLSTLMAILVYKLGMAINHFTKREFCASTRGMGLALTQWYCRHNGVAEFLSRFRVNQWEYAHQRCKGWENPDVDPGEGSPAVDFLMLFSAAG